MHHIAKCHTKFENCHSNPKCVAVFVTQKALDLLYHTIKCYTNLRIATQIGKCLAVFATLTKGQKYREASVKQLFQFRGTFEL